MVPVDLEGLTPDQKIRVIALMAAAEAVSHPGQVVDYATSYTRFVKSGA